MKQANLGKDWVVLPVSLALLLIGCPAADLSRATFRTTSDAINTVAFSRDGKIVASGDNNGMLFLWDVVSGQRLPTSMRHNSVISAVAFSPHGKTLVAGSFDYCVKVWDVATGTEALKLESYSTLEGLVREGGQLSGNVLSVAFAPDGRSVAASDNSGMVRIWNLCTGKVSREFRFDPVGFIRCISFSPDGKSLVAASDSEQVKMWDLATGKEELAISLEKEADDLQSVAFSPDGKFIATGSGTWEAIGQVIVWDAASGKKEATFQRKTKPGFALMKSVDGFHVCYSPDGRIIASGGMDWEITLWDTETGKQLNQLARSGESR